MYHYNKGKSSRDKKDPYLTYMLEEETEEPPIPEPYRLYLEMNEAKYRSWWAGGYSSQPYIFLKEFDACRKGERDFEKIKRLNREMEDRYAREKKKSR